MVNEIVSKKLDLKLSSKPRKEKAQAPLTKIVVRKLPPTFTEEEFRNAISPVPENNYFAFVAADKRLGPHSYSRVYINFVNPDEIFSFRDRFDGYVFVDQKGSEYPALVEYASFQKIPKSNHMKKDIRCGTIDEDPDYVAFLDLLQNPETVSLPAIETLLEEIENNEKELRANNGVLKIKTPLLEYVEQRYKAGDKKRRKEYDRRKAREEEKRRRKEYRNKDVQYSRELRERQKAKRREEEKIKWKERREEREKQLKEKRAERAERSKSDKSEDRSSFKSNDVPPPNEGEDPAYEKKSPQPPYKGDKGEEPPVPQKTKRYSEVRKKEERDKKRRDEDAKEERCSDVKENKREVEKRDEDGNKKECEGRKRETDQGNVERDKQERDDREEDEGDEEKEKCKKEERDKDKKEKRDYHREEERDKDKKEVEDKRDVEEEKKDGEEGDRDKKAERRIRNKDRPSMQLYRPGQSRLKTRPAKSNEECGSSDQRANDGSGGSGDQRVNNDGSSSSSCVSPVMGTSEKGGVKGDVAGKGDDKETSTSKPSNRAGNYTGRKSYTGTSTNKYRDSRKSNYYWDKDGYWEDRHYSKYKDDYYEGNRTGTGTGGSKGRKGYSYYQERESKKYSKGTGSGKDQEAPASTSKDPGNTGSKDQGNTGSQFKSLTFRRSTSQE